MSHHRQMNVGKRTSVDEVHFSTTTLLRWRPKHRHLRAQCVMMSWHGNMIRIIGPLWGESIGDLTKDQLYAALMSSLKLAWTHCWTNSCCRWFKTPWRSCDITVMGACHKQFIHIIYNCYIGVALAWNDRLRSQFRTCLDNHVCWIGVNIEVRTSGRDTVYHHATMLHYNYQFISLPTIVILWKFFVL